MTENEKLDLILQKISGLDEKVEGIDKRVSGLDEKVDSIDKRVSSLETDMKEVRQQVAKTNFVLENEIRVNIQRVAEGHLDLSRNLHEALRIDNEKEMLSIRVNVLETELRRIKERIESIA